jgi:RNA polymerase sigma-70 factor, ECF subfamily
MKTDPSFQGLPGSSRQAPISSCPNPATITPMLKRVLIVDDSPLVRKAVCSLFTLDGFSVCGEAGDGAQAVEEAKQTRPDIIVLDFSMPVMDGIRAAKALKQIMPDVPLILFTAHAGSALEKDALAAGITAIISKQQDASDLVTKAHELLSPKCEAETRISDRQYPVRTMLSREHPECCGLAHRLRPEGAFRLSKQKQDAQFAQLVQPSQGRVYRLALRITRKPEDAEDVQQETMLKVHRKLGQFEGRSRFTTWISRIAINEALMCVRKRRSTVHEALDETMPSTDEILSRDDFQSVIEGADAAYSRKELRDLLRRAVATLRPANRVVFLLRAIEQLSTTETARVLKISASSVKARLRRARSELQDYLRNACSDATHEHLNGMAKPDSDRQPVHEGWLI